MNFADNWARVFVVITFLTFGDTPHYCESVGDKPAIVFVAYAGVEEEPVTIPFKK